MTEQFALLRAQLQAEFPQYEATMGLAWYECNSQPSWWIDLKANASKCECCGGENHKGDIQAYSCTTFEAALERVRTLVNV
jgi:hypothetical protein